MVKRGVDKKHTHITPFDDVASPSMPKTGNGLTRWIGRRIMQGMGWTFRGKLPDEPRVIFVGAPHTSSRDSILAISAMMSVGLKCSWMMKKEAFFWPFGGLWKILGGIPVDRSRKGGLTGQMVAWFTADDKAWLGITPAGTRRKVESFKKGYLRIAYAANVPVFLVGINSPTKEVVLDRIWPLTGDADTDNADIKGYFDRNYTGIRPNHRA